MPARIPQEKYAYDGIDWWHRIACCPWCYSEIKRYPVGNFLLCSTARMSYNVGQRFVIFECHEGDMGENREENFRESIAHALNDDGIWMPCSDSYKCMFTPEDLEKVVLDCVAETPVFRPPCKFCGARGGGPDSLGHPCEMCPKFLNSDQHLFRCLEKSGTANHDMGSLWAIRSLLEGVRDGRVYAEDVC